MSLADAIRRMRARDPEAGSNAARPAYSLMASPPGTALAPANDASAGPVRFSLRFALRNGQGGSVLGGPGTSAEELREILLSKYGSRLASVDGQPVP